MVPIDFDGTVLAANDINTLYKSAIDAVCSKGYRCSPRGFLTTEITHAILQLHSPRNRLVTILERNANSAFALAEWLWTMIGSADGTIPLHYKNNFNK